ncbi:MAG: hypothetical protein P8J50_02430 [Acidimicrobiales bacterium]|nr:hypothetical protein [Acidimicrobiales bacterium]
MPYRIEFDGPQQSKMMLRVKDGGNQRVLTAPWTASVGLPDSHMVRFLKQAHDELQAEIVEVDGRTADHQLELNPAEYGLADVHWQKRCAWQHEDGRDLYCTAIQQDQDSIQWIYSVGDRLGYETDLATCQACAIPDERLLCDGFSHAKVYPKTTMGPGKAGHPEQISGASCRLGNSEVDSPEECRPSGNHCWHQIATVQSWEPVATSGLHLLEAFDFLDSEWRHRYPSNPLVVPTSLAEAAQLTDPVQTRQQFSIQVGRVGELVQKLKVDGGLFTEKARKGAVERLRQWCDEHAPAGVAAVDELAKINTLRNAVSHTDPASLADALNDIGISYPPESWSEAWQHVISRIESALRELRREISAIS